MSTGDINTTIKKGLCGLIAMFSCYLVYITYSKVLIAFHESNPGDPLPSSKMAMFGVIGFMMVAYCLVLSLVFVLICSIVTALFMDAKKDVENAAESANADIEQGDVTANADIEKGAETANMKIGEDKLPLASIEAAAKKLKGGGRRKRDAVQTGGFTEVLEGIGSLGGLATAALQMGNTSGSTTRNGTTAPGAANASATAPVVTAPGAANASTTAPVVTAPGAANASTTAPGVGNDSATAVSGTALEDVATDKAAQETTISNVLNIFSQYLMSPGYLNILGITLIYGLIHYFLFSFFVIGLYNSDKDELSDVNYTMSLLGLYVSSFSLGYFVILYYI